MLNSDKNRYVLESFFIEKSSNEYKCEICVSRKTLKLNNQSRLEKSKECFYLNFEDSLSFLSLNIFDFFFYDNSVQKDISLISLLNSMSNFAANNSSNFKKINANVGALDDFTGELIEGTFDIFINENFIIKNLPLNEEVEIPMFLSANGIVKAEGYKDLNFKAFGTNDFFIDLLMQKKDVSYE